MSDLISPSPNGLNGDRRPDGTFAKGNAGGRGNPYALKIARFRTAIIEAITEDDIKEIIAELVAQAKAGSLPAIKELLDRLVGRAVPLTISTDSEGDIQEVRVMRLEFDE